MRAQILNPSTESLLSAVPMPTLGGIPTVSSSKGVPPAPSAPVRCPFQTCCPKKIGEGCETDVPVLVEKQVGTGHRISCHLSIEEMSEQGSFVDPRASDSESTTTIED